MGKVSMSYLFSFSRYQRKCIIKIADINFMIYLRLTSKAMADRADGGGGGGGVEENLNISRTKRAF